MQKVKPVQGSNPHPKDHTIQPTELREELPNNLQIKPSYQKCLNY